MHLTALIEGRRSLINDEQHVIEVVITNDRAEHVHSLVLPVNGLDEQGSVWWQAKAVIMALGNGVPSWAWPKGTVEEMVRFVKDRIQEVHTNVGYPVYRLSIDLSA